MQDYKILETNCLTDHFNHEGKNLKQAFIEVKYEDQTNNKIKYLCCCMFSNKVYEFYESSLNSPLDILSSQYDEEELEHFDVINISSFDGVDLSEVLLDDLYESLQIQEQTNAWKLINYLFNLTLLEEDIQIKIGEENANKLISNINIPDVYNNYLIINSSYEIEDAAFMEHLITEVTYEYNNITKHLYLDSFMSIPEFFESENDIKDLLCTDDEDRVDILEPYKLYKFNNINLDFENPYELLESLEDLDNNIHKLLIKYITLINELDSNDSNELINDSKNKLITNIDLDKYNECF